MGTLFWRRPRIRLVQFVMVANLLTILARNVRKRRRLKFAAGRIWLAARKSRLDRNRNVNGTAQTQYSTNQKGTLETCFSTRRNLACADGTSGSAFGSSPASTSSNGFLSAGNGSRPRRNRRRSIHTTVWPTVLATPPVKQMYPIQHPALLPPIPVTVQGLSIGKPLTLPACIVGKVPGPGVVVDLDLRNNPAELLELLYSRVRDGSNFDDTRILIILCCNNTGAADARCKSLFQVLEYPEFRLQHLGKNMMELLEWMNGHASGGLRLSPLPACVTLHCDKLLATFEKPAQVKKI